MYLNDIFQFNLFMYCVGFGAFLALVFDIYKSVNIIFFGHYKYIMAFDICYGLTASVLVFLFTLAFNFGRIRVFMVVGTAAGLYCWFVTFSRFFVKLLCSFFTKIKPAFLFVSSVITLPFRLFLPLVRKIYRKIPIKKAKYFHFFKNRLEN